MSPRFLAGQVLAILSDGVPRTVPALAERVGATSGEINTTLADLETAGLPLEWLVPECVGLATAFIALDQITIASLLRPVRAAVEIQIEAIIDSTNAALLRRARLGAAPLLPEHLTVLAAELQTAGRGRQGRAWSAQAGSSLAVSFARHLPRGLAQLGGLSLMCGLAVRDALLRFGVELQLKWPNDLLWQGGKLGGILIEVHPLGAASSVAVIGIGLNVAPDLRRKAELTATGAGSLGATDLAAAGALAPVDRNRLVAELADTLTARLDQFLVTGFAPYREDWNAHHAYRDCPVEMIERGSVIHAGIARGVDVQGRLNLETASGPLSVIAGDVSLRPRDPK